MTSSSLKTNQIIKLELNDSRNENKIPTRVSELNDFRWNKSFAIINIIEIVIHKGNVFNFFSSGLCNPMHPFSNQKKTDPDFIFYSAAFVLPP